MSTLFVLFPHRFLKFDISFFKPDLEDNVFRKENIKFLARNLKIMIVTFIIQDTHYDRTKLKKL